MINTTTLIGYVGATPDEQPLPSGSKVAKFRLYVNERFTKDGEPQDRTHRFQIEAWGKTAEFVTAYIHQGSRVAVEGSLVEDTWVDKTSGENRSRVIIKANRIENLTPKKAEVPENDEF